MSESSWRRRIWHVPIQIAAGALAVASILVGLLASRNQQLEPGISALQYALASASLTLTIARIVRIRYVAVRELELVALAIGGLLLREVVVYVAAVLMAIAIFFLLVS